MILQNKRFTLRSFSVSEGAIAQALQRLGAYLQIETGQILTAIRNAAHKHADETGWKINGIGHQLWAFLTDRWALVHINKSRGSKVPKAIPVEFSHAHGFRSNPTSAVPPCFQKSFI